MAITNVDQLIDAMGNDSSRLIIDKASLANAVTGGFHSLWTAQGQPGSGAVPPTTPTVCSNALVGSLQFDQQTAPATSYLGILEVISSNGLVTLEIHDRLMHDSGLRGNITTSQPVNMQLDANLATSNLSERKGDSNYSDVQWWLEWYSPTGTGTSNATVNVTYNDGTTGNLNLIAVGGTAIQISRMLPLNSFIPTAAAGKYIRGVNSIQLSATTNTAGDFGVTATRYRAGSLLTAANMRYSTNWADLGFPNIPNSSCLFPIVVAAVTNTGSIRGTGKIVHG
jgi:hypothetical protein